MFTTVKEHMEIVKGLEGIGWQEILGFSNQQLLPFTKEIDTEKKRRILKQLPTEYGKKLVAYPKFLSKIISLLEAEISAYRIERFIGSANEKLFDRSYEELEAALKTEAISDRYVAVYLQYYFSSHLSEKECRILNGNLEFFETYGNKKLQDLNCSERMFLKEPIFSGDFLCEVIAEKDFFQDLGKANVLNLLKYLTEFPLPMLNKEEYRQIVKNAEELYPLLRKIMLRLHKDIQSCFLTRWLENRQLLFDLNRFVRQGWISQGNFYTRAGYVQEIYRYAIKAVDRLEYHQESVLLYAVKHQKKHFLRLYEENTELFLGLPWNSILFEEVFYKDYVNLNTLNLQNLKECKKLKGCSVIKKDDMIQKEYTFAEIKLFASCTNRAYIRLYHKLNYRRVDDRLRVMQEVVKKRLLDKVISEETLETVAAFLSHKPLSKWMKEELGNISGLDGTDIPDLFLSWKEVVRFLPEVKNGFQLRYLIANKEKLSRYSNFQSVYADLLKNDPHWEWMKSTFAFSDLFIREYEANIQTFLEQGGSEILYEFYKGDTGQTEMLRRLLVAELMGKFKDLKYHDTDLERELAFPISEKQVKLWAENLLLQRKEWKIWEEDRFLPVMQIGELPDKTCLSYKTGMYRKCLLSCFDSNKKIIYISYQGKIVLRAILRLTKASKEKIEKENKEFEFVDFTKDMDKKEKTEQLVLFLERAYVKGIAKKLEREMFHILFCMVREKTEKLCIPLLLSYDYIDYMSKENFQKESRYIYISATKGNEQYLDSLGGKHGIASEGKYLKTTVYLPMPWKDCEHERCERMEFKEASQENPFVSSFNV